ncbi:MAG: outer membrane beta-barrel protein [Reichenbachiella sp.]
MKKVLASALIILSLIITSEHAQAQLSEEVVKKTPELPFDIAIDLGFNLLYGKPGHWDDVNWFRSKSYNFYIIKPFDVSNHVQFVPGLGVSFDQIGSKNGDFLDSQEDIENGEGFFSDLPANIEAKYGRLGFAAINLPLELKFNLKENGIKLNPFIAIGGNVSFVFKNKAQLKYQNTISGEKEKIKRTGDGDLLDSSKFRLAATGRIGVGSVSIFYKHYFTPVFKSDSQYSSDTNMSTVGLTITGF